MSTLWSRHFEWARWTGDFPGDGRWWPGDLSPEKIVQNMVWLRLWEDPLLREIFGVTRIEMMDVRNPYEFRDLPRLQVYLGNLSEEQEPTNTAKNMVAVYVGIRYPAEASFNQLQPGEPGVPEALRQVRLVLSAHKSLVVPLTGRTDELAMATRSEQDGDINFLLDVESESGGRAAVTQQVQWLYHVKVDFSTGRLENAALAIEP